MKCPKCDGPLVVYEGGEVNPHKLDTAFCERCGVRWPLSQAVAERKAVKGPPEDKALTADETK